MNSALSTSIMYVFDQYELFATDFLYSGQQISWLAARAINHKFIRIYDQSIPEDYAEYALVILLFSTINTEILIYVYRKIKSASSFYPSPQQVATTSVATLRACGFSGRKAEYSKSLLISAGMFRLTLCQYLISRSGSLMVGCPRKNFSKHLMKSCPKC